MTKMNNRSLQQRTNKMKNLLLIAIVLFILLPSCEEDIKVTLPSSGRKVVIEGNIENDKFPVVIITRTNPLFSSVSGTTLADYMVLDAKVFVTNGLFTDTLTLTIDSSASVPLVYKGHSITGVPGQTYNLTVIADGKTFSASTTIPALVHLDSVWFKRKLPLDTIGLGYAWARLSDPPGYGNAYRWYAKRGSIDRRYIIPEGGATSDDKWIDGKTFDFFYDAGVDPTVTPAGEHGFYKIGDTICIKFCSIDYNTELFYMTFEQSVMTNGNPFASPVTILGNIRSDDGKEALGVWAGFGATFDTIYAH